MTTDAVTLWCRYKYSDEGLY